MNEIIKAIEERMSIRKFKRDMPVKEDIEQIIEAGLFAANGMGRQQLQSRLRTKNCVTNYLLSTARSAVGKRVLIRSTARPLS